ncbi:uncharacterized protein LOC113549018 [Rhopalosiphum maidis]|uniref:uncharacterized protein LOC113549018 n=1 Tax=Rhopalosiphum maidis TaxID=43146 RepID=UPI000EFF611C|nr:uncharacterized protein LOC113549018 [Rhopalosiphum maidis]
MKRLFIIFVLIYLNVHDRQCMIPSNILEVDTFDVPSPYEFLWITTMSYCNVYYLTYNMFIRVGVPVKKPNYSNDDIAAFLIPDNIDDWSDETVLDLPYKFLKLREASQIIESFVFEIKEYQNVTGAEDKITGLKIWESVEDNFVNFMNNIYILSNQVNQVIYELNIEQQTVYTTDSSTMMYLYLDIFDQMVDIMSESIVPYQNAFNFLEKYNSKNNEEKNIKQELKNENNLNSQEYTRVKLVEVYDLYIKALRIFYNSIEIQFSGLHFITWYDLNSSKSIFDYKASQLLTYIIKLKEYVQEAYKYNKATIPKLTSKIHEQQ